MDVASVRLPRVNITTPDDIHRRAKEAGPNDSRLAAQAVAHELDRAKIAEFDRQMAELEAEYGPPREEDMARAKAWMDRVLRPESLKESA